MKRGLRTRCTIHRTDNTELETMAVNLTTWRERNKMTQRDVADACGVSVGTVSRSESGVNDISVDAECVLAEFWGVGIDALRLPDAMPYNPAYSNDAILNGHPSKGVIASHLKSWKGAGQKGTPAHKVSAARQKAAQARASSKLKKYKDE